MNKVVRDDMVAVLYSPGYGAGWSTWNREYPEILFDPAIVELVESAEFEKLEAYVILKYPEIYTGGLKNLKIKWLPAGTQFRVSDYDGNESIETRDSVDWITA